MVRLSVTFSVALEKPLAGISYAFPRMTNCRRPLAGMSRQMSQGTTVLPCHRLARTKLDRPCTCITRGCEERARRRAAQRAAAVLPDAARMPEWSGGASAHNFGVYHEERFCKDRRRQAGHHDRRFQGCP